MTAAATHLPNFADHEIYLSADVEVDGPIPGVNSMRSVGIWCFTRDGTSLGTFSANLLPLPGAHCDPVTMAEFWDRNPDAWSAATRAPENPLLVMRRLVDFIDNVRDADLAQGGSGRIVLTGYPAAFDHAFLRYYLVRLLRTDILGHGALDIRSLAAGRLQWPYRRSSKLNLPASWQADVPENLTHVALEDAILQGQLLLRILHAGNP